MGTLPKSISPLSSVTVKNNLLYVSPSFLGCSLYSQALSVRHRWEHFWPTCLQCRHGITRFSCVAVLRKSDLESDDENRSKHKVRRKSRNSSSKAVDGKQEDEKRGMDFRTTIPRKPRRGRRSEAVAVEDFVRDSLDRTFASIQQQNPELLENTEYIMRDRVVNKMDSETSGVGGGGGGGGAGEDEDEDEVEVEDDVGRRKGKTKKMVVEEEDPNWPLDADVGWGIRASEYFQKHPIKNVVGEDGVEIDWEGEIEDNWVNEINCLEWESFAFHPSPLIVLAFERYNSATDNWKTLKELEKAVKVYWSAKDRLPPRLIL